MIPLFTFFWFTLLLGLVIGFPIPNPHTWEYYSQLRFTGLVFECSVSWFLLEEQLLFVFLCGMEVFLGEYLLFTPFSFLIAKCE